MIPYVIPSKRIRPVTRLPSYGRRTRGERRLLNPDGVAILFFYPLGVRVRVGAPHRCAHDGPGQPLPYRARSPMTPGLVPEAVVAPGPAFTLRILHLSAARGPARAGGAVAPPAGPGRGLAQEPRADRGRGRAVELVCFTGDVPFAGRREEYVRAADFVRELLRRLGFGPERPSYSPPCRSECIWAPSGLQGEYGLWRRGRLHVYPPVA